MNTRNAKNILSELEMISIITTFKLIIHYIFSS